MLYTSACVVILLCATLTQVTAQQDPVCPYPSDDFIYYPNPSDCSQYYQCYNGTKTLRQCPLNYLWNTVEGYCDEPQNVDCNRNTDPTAAPITTPTVPTPPTTTVLTTTGNPLDTTTTAATGYTPDPLCPYPSETLIFYPYPDDCNRYYECFEGRRYLMSCPERLYWNPIRQACDWPENVYCAVSTTPTPPTTTSGPTTPPVTTPPSPTTPFVPDPSCPYPSDDFTYFPDDKDCSQYYECYQGTKQLQKCPANFFWNTETNYCDYLENVDCTKNYEPTTPSSATTDSTSPVTTPSTAPTTQPTNPADTTTPTQPTTQGTPPTTPTTQPTTPSTPSTTPVSLCYRHPDGTFLSDPDDCSKYIECNLGHEVIGQCPDGLLWHETITSCDFPDHVDCY